MRPTNGQCGAASAGIMFAVFTFATTSVFVVVNQKKITQAISQLKKERSDEASLSNNISAASVTQALLSPVDPNGNWDDPDNAPAWFPKRYLGNKMPESVSNPVNDAGWNVEGGKLNISVEQSFASSLLKEESNTAAQKSRSRSGHSNGRNGHANGGENSGSAPENDDEQATAVLTRDPPRVSATVDFIRPVLESELDPDGRPYLISYVDTEIKTCIDAAGKMVSCDEPGARPAEVNARLPMAAPPAPECSLSYSGSAPIETALVNTLDFSLSTNHVTTKARYELAAGTTNVIAVPNAVGTVHENPMNTQLRPMANLTLPVEPAVAAPACEAVNTRYQVEVAGPVNDPDGAKNSCQVDVPIIKNVRPICTLYATRSRFGYRTGGTSIGMIVNFPGTISARSIHGVPDRVPYPFDAGPGVYTIQGTVTGTCGTQTYTVNCSPVTVRIDPDPVCRIRASSTRLTVGQTSYVSLQYLQGVPAEFRIGIPNWPGIPTTAYAHTARYTGWATFNGWMRDIHNKWRYCGGVSIHAGPCRCPGGFYEPPEARGIVPGGQACFPHWAIGMGGGAPLFRVSPPSCALTYWGPRSSLIGGCFHPHTKIRLAHPDGSRSEEQKTITLLQEGDWAWDPVHQRGFRVEEIIAGLEEEPLWTITLKDRKSATITSKHPMLTKRGFIQARFLKVGDYTKIDNGNWAEITHVQRHTETKKQYVFNLALERPEGFENRDLTVEADGIVTGDLNVQKKLEKEQDEIHLLSNHR